MSCCNSGYLIQRTRKGTNMRRHSILALARSASRELFTNNRYYEIASQPPKGASWPMWEAIRYVTDSGPDAVNSIITGHHYRSHRMFSSGEVPLGVVPPNKRGSPLDDKDQRQAAGAHQNPQPLPSDGTIEITTSTSFQSLLQLSATVPVVLDAYAPWCAPCKQLDPILKQIASTLAGSYNI
jgi:thiol-disulfide isomerase/thioredoxin